MSRKWIVAGGLVVVALAAAIAGVFAFRARPAPTQPSAPVDSAAAQPEVILPGIIQSKESVKVPVPVDGRIAAFFVEVGAEVYEGELLAEIKNEEVERSEEQSKLELERAQQRVTNLESMLAAARLEASRATADAARVKAEYDRAARAFERQKVLLAAGATPRRTFEKAESDFRTIAAESAQLNDGARVAEDRVSTIQRDLDAAKKLLDGVLEDLEATKTRVAAGQVLSPAGGIVVARRGEVGENVNGIIEDLFVIATDLSQLEVIVEPNPDVLARMKPGLHAGVSLADVPNEQLPATVRAVENGKVVLSFENPSPLVKPGMTAQVRIQLGT